MSRSGEQFVTRRVAVSTLLSLGVTLAGCAQAGDEGIGAPDPANAPVGSVVRPGRTQVPLPPGDWTEIGRQDHGSTADGQGSYSSNVPQVTVAYAEINQGRLRNLLVVSTNVAPSTWAPADACVPPDPRFKGLYLQDSRSHSINDSDCLEVYKANLRQPHGTDTFYAQFIMSAQQYGGIPVNTVIARFSVIGAQNFMVYRLITFPERNGVTGDAWDADAQGAEEKRYTDALIRWATAFRAHVVDGTAMRL